MERVQQKKMRAKPVIGSRVAKELLYRLRELRNEDAEQDAWRGCNVLPIHDDRAEIEEWEELVRDLVTHDRREPRETLHLDRETMAALDSACTRLNNDDAREYRRRFALHAIKAVCEAWVYLGSGFNRREDFRVDIRPPTYEERELDQLTRQIALPGNDRGL
jgi:hypothetical protein